MQKNKTVVGAAALALLGFSDVTLAVPVSGQGTWESTLQGRALDGNLSAFEAYYDTAQNITWLADANYAHTSGYDADGRMNWSTANGWAATLNPYGSGVTGWRLPTTVDVGNDGPTIANANTTIYRGVDFGYNVTSHSEMSYMYYVTLGNSPRYNTSGQLTGCSSSLDYCLTNTGPFSNLQSQGYWSATEYAPNPSVAWIFNFRYGWQGYYGYLGEAVDLYAWAVHSGDVGTSSHVDASVPEPGALGLLCAGLSLLGWARNKRRR